jgi:peptide-methionine (S)-S-oxide reductase
VRVEYDPTTISYDALLDEFWACHDPTTKDRQGFDIGSQYRSVIFVVDGNEGEQAELSMVQHQKGLRRPIVTEIIPLEPYWPAEAYHQQYVAKQRR